jgi:hypothetical protein
MIWLSVFDLVRRWPAPEEQGAAIRLRWLTDLLRERLTKLAADVSRQYETLKPQKETVASRVSSFSSQKSFLTFLIGLVCGCANDESGCQSQSGAGSLA